MGLAQLLQDPEQFVALETLAPGELKQLLCSDDDSSPLRCACNRDATTPTEFEKTLVSKYPQGSVDGVGVHSQDCCKVPGRRETFARQRLPFGDSPAEFASHLIVERGGSVAIGLDTYFDISDSSTMSDAAPGSTITRPAPSGQPTSREPVVVLIPEARERQQKRHRAFAWLAVALLLLGLFAYAAMKEAATSGQGIPSPKTTAPGPVPAGAFAGNWSLHTSSLTIRPDGHGSFIYPFDVRCGPTSTFPCDVWTAAHIIDGGHAQITLMSVGRTVATGRFTRSDDQYIVPDVTVTLQIRFVYGVRVLYVTSTGRQPMHLWLTHYLCSPVARKYYDTHTILTAPDLMCGA